MITFGPKQNSTAHFGRAVLMITSLALLGACEQLSDFNLLKPNAEATNEASAQTSTKFVERDVEAPEVFSVAEAGLWDGRPSLGGVWVAHPDVADPERVIIRNKANGKFVIGALFRRERAIPGPRLQLSSDAAAALSMLAGQPIELEVTALRREETPLEMPVEDTVEAADQVETSTLDPIAAASSAIEKADKKPLPAPAVEAAAKPKSASTSKLSKAFVQIGIFSVEANAKGAAAQMRSAGMVPTVKEQTSKGKTFWRVLVGPANSSAERSALVKKIHKTGFTDAYAVTH
ncbi:SPOR domain-containing protein [Cognatishimia sp. WU-CL00825]|uniref:SPOR domain-containing protein n=1 Tax=Cognatishimia sp. WU-CL00825 TaxID=3127658 RepID=UPI003106FAA7